MHGLILAGGMGSRLSADGVTEPKALVQVGGRPQLLRVSETLDALGCETVTCMLRTGVSAEVIAKGHPHRRVIPCETPSSLHTLALGFEVVPPGPVFCTMVDTVMPWSDWLVVWNAWQEALAEGVQVLLAVTHPRIGDAQPLHVRTDQHNAVAAIGASALGSPLVTAGVYGFAPAARPLAGRALDHRVDRMRGFLAWVAGDRHAIRSVTVARALDLDRRDDLDEANAWAPAVAP